MHAPALCPRGRRSGSVIVTVALAAAALLTGCSEGAAEPDSAPTFSPGAGTESQTPAETPSKPPLALRDKSEWSMCHALAPVYTSWGQVLSPTQDVTITGVRLEGAVNVRQPGRFAVVPVVGRPADAAGFTRGWPSPAFVKATDLVDWKGRITDSRPTLTAGSHHVLATPVRLLDPEAPASFGALTITYTDALGEHEVTDSSQHEFARDCTAD